MRLEEAKEIIKSESLEDYNINLDHEIEAGEIVIVGKDGKWKVGIANDRAEIVTTQSGSLTLKMKRWMISYSGCVD